MRIVFFEANNWNKRIIKKELSKHKLKFVREPISLSNSNEARFAEIISVFPSSKVNLLILNKLKKLKMIATRSTGYDHIDLKECKRRKIKVCNVPKYGENTVAEHTFALILALSRKVYKSILKTRQNDFELTGLRGFDLNGKTLGVIGVGNIGMHVIRIARGFNMKVLAIDRHPDKKLSNKLGFKYISFEEVIKNCDILTLHVPYVKENHHMINRRVLRKMKKGAYLINTARGDLVDTKALISSLDSGKLAGVGLDVIEGEELIKNEDEVDYRELRAKNLKQLAEDHLLLSRDNVIFTPHIAFYTSEALMRILKQTIVNIKCFTGESKGKECLVCK